MFTSYFSSQGVGGWEAPEISGHKSSLLGKFWVSHDRIYRGSIHLRYFCDLNETMVNYEELSERQAGHPLLILIQLLVEGLLNGNLNRATLTSMRDLSCAVVTLCGVGINQQTPAESVLWDLCHCAVDHLAGICSGTYHFRTPGSAGQPGTWFSTTAFDTDSSWTLQRTPLLQSVQWLVIALKRLDFRMRAEPGGIPLKHSKQSNEKKKQEKPKD